MKDRFDHFAHVVIDVLHHHFHCAFAVAFVQQLPRSTEDFFALLKDPAVVVADQVNHFCLFDRGLHFIQVKESLASFRVFRAFVCRQHGVEFHGQQHGVQHLAFGAAGMHVSALDGHVALRGIKSLIFQFTDLAAVHGVGKIGAEFRDIKKIHSPACFFVGRESHPHLAVRVLGIFEQVFHGGYNRRHPGLVIRAKQGGTVRGDEFLPFVFLQFREHARAHHQPALQVQNHITAIVGGDDLRIDAFAPHVLRGVHMGDQPDHGQILLKGRRQGGCHVTVLVQRDLLQPHDLHFIDQPPGELQLPPGAGEFLRVGLRLGIHLHVFKKTSLD